ncbi:MAG: DUF1893 domain-containing protein [Sphaerochaetaceae bacterium]
MGSNNNEYPLTSWMIDHTLNPSHTLELLDENQTIVFASTSKWLHPLFEVEQFLIESKYEAKDLFLHDRIAGKAAALLTMKIGFRRIKIEVMSHLAQQLYDDYLIQYTYVDLVERIACQTERLLQTITDVDEVYQMLYERAQNSKARENTIS